LELKPDGKGFRVKSHVKFHLFINTAPCGDARIFSPHEAANKEERVDNHPNRKARGQLRTKIESGEGTIPVKSSEKIQTWDGVLEGERFCKNLKSIHVSRCFTFPHQYKYFQLNTNFNQSAIYDNSMHAGSYCPKPINFATDAKQNK